MKYTAEEVRAMAKMVGDEFSPHAGLMLTAYAERIKADEGAVPACWRYYNSLGEVVSEWIDGVPPERHYSYPNNEDITDQITVECAYTRPPAQAAQVDFPECTGNPNDCPENEGFGCCNLKLPPQDDSLARFQAQFDDGDEE